MSSMYDILVVDDQNDITDIVAEFLRDEGYNVRVAHDGASALLEVLEHPPALVLLDVSMPVMTGEELLVHLRKNGFPKLPIILMTAGQHPEVFYNLGATTILRKPFDLTTLLKVVDQYVC